MIVNRNFFTFIIRYSIKKGVKRVFSFVNFQILRICENVEIYYLFRIKKICRDKKICRGLAIYCIYALYFLILINQVFHLLLSTNTFILSFAQNFELQIFFTICIYLKYCAKILNIHLKHCTTINYNDIQIIRDREKIIVFIIYS